MTQQRWLVVAGVFLILCAAALFAFQKYAGGTSLLTIGVILTALSATVGRRGGGPGR